MRLLNFRLGLRGKKRIKQVIVIYFFGVLLQEGEVVYGREVDFKQGSEVSEDLGQGWGVVGGEGKVFKQERLILRVSRCI